MAEASVWGLSCLALRCLVSCRGLGHRELQEQSCGGWCEGWWRVLCLLGRSPRMLWVCLSRCMLWLLTLGYACSSLCKQERVWGFGEGRKAYNKRWQNVTLSTQSGLAEERESCLERTKEKSTNRSRYRDNHTSCSFCTGSLGRGWRWPWVTVAEGSPCTGKVFFKAVKLSRSLFRVCSSWIAANRDLLRNWSK